MERGNASRPTSFYSQASSSSCCSVADSKREMQDLMGSFIVDIQRIRDSLEDTSATKPAATPVRSDDPNIPQPIPGAYAAESNPDEYEHKGIWCDCCNQKVYGTRHKCLDCYNFDLCNPCYTTKDIQSTHADMPHTFEAIHPPQVKPKAPGATKPPSAPQMQCLCSVLPRALGCHICKPRDTKASRPISYRCDSCREVISGTRHRCMTCPDFDLCETCYAVGAPLSDHSPVHRYMHIEHPIRIITAPPISPSPTAPVCAGSCVHEGPRYKCENCDALDICVECLGDIEKATVEHSAFHAIQGSDQVVRFVPYTKGANKRPSSAVVHPADCDACDETIIGTRHKCTVCFDFDLCDFCYAINAEPLDHKSDHEMLHLDHPQRVRVHVVPPAGATSANAPIPPVPNALHRAWCDGCSERIRGVRHKCLDCPDFDFCDACRGREHFNGTHEFYAIVEPGEMVVRNAPPALEALRPRGRVTARMSTLPPAVPAPPAPIPSPSQNQPHPPRPTRPTPSAAHSAACDMCSSRIRGVRFKCTTCPDYDVCESCFRVSEDVHPGHSFAKVYNQGDIIVRKSPQGSFRHHARCDVCQNQIMGIRYKCIHPACPDFDICENCEAMPFPVHPETHALVKLRSHISNYDGLSHIFSFASRGQVPQPSTLQIPAPIVRIPSPRSHRSPDGMTVEPNTAIDVFHTAAPSPVVPLSTLGCTIVPHTTIVASLPESPSGEPARVLSPQLSTPPVIPSPIIPSPPAIPASLLPPTPERKLTDSWAAASSSAKLDEHKLHHSSMYKPSYEAPPAIPIRTVVEEPKSVTIDQLARELQVERAKLEELKSSDEKRIKAQAAPVIVDEERDPEAPQMSVLNASPISFPGVPSTESVPVESVIAPEPATTPERVGTPKPEPPSLLSTYPYQAAASEPRSPVLAVSEPSREPSPVSSVSTLSVDASILDAAFVEDRSIVDGQVVSGGAEFAKSWRMRNTGPTAWPAGTTISFVGGHSMLTEPARIHWTISGDLSPGQEVDLEVDMKAPEEPGRYVSYWRLKTPEGEAFGARVWCDIIVAELERAGSSGSSEISASSIIVPHAPGMSAASVDTTTASPTIHSVPSTVHSASIADTADIESLASLDSDDSDVWEEVRRQTEAAAIVRNQTQTRASARSEGDRYEMVYESE